MTAGADVVWLDGEFRPVEAAIAANDRGLLLADGVFDTALVLNARIFRGEDHLSRLLGACAFLEIPVEAAVLRSAMQALALRCGDGSIRLTVTRGPAPRGLAFPAETRPTILGSVAPLAPAMMFRPVSLVTTPIRRNETSPTARMKTLSYLDAVLATQEAKAKGADDALFLNTAGRLASTALANLFVVEADRLVTPRLSDGVLPGIMRRWVIDVAPEVGLTAAEVEVTPQAARGRAMIATNSLRLIAPVARLDGDAMPRSEAARSLAARLCETIATECGRDPRDAGASLAGLASPD
ncbi:aminotransferase class IV [Aurantimonas sp. 22II-16-19i]|uniref:aminotransferase class IV n=1 Tax=Aurantimonas sp. 22II-16-19i TaxID=1317114 RepID=UPI0009F7B8E7|nr:aminotransferase class IV [Aurantimonas sp. 22II-16-19i]ORE94759.1 aminotransferase class IV protein [Aurantimonas sp. 22II-16-19i]